MKIKFIVTVVKETEEETIYEVKLRRCTWEKYRHFTTIDDYFDLLDFFEWCSDRSYSFEMKF